ncbi:sigma-54-dependent transcriptional regulator family protein [Williamsia sterculiae]|uniref:GAF domain-containing protein n=1 Tax=Williamsia sterculiae TaxID=1344003 RepID=A0A1N7HA02_9NOCA|nr:diguanylate phosphodiesterase [Williamsia sterculiae]SIS21603.1 hypothetical protein SAMN05445060_3787 [Williamsia sterculiae]
MSEVRSSGADAPPRDPPRPGSQSRVRAAYESFRQVGSHTGGSVREVVRDSWARSVRSGADPTASVTADMSAADFNSYRAGHPMTAVRPLVQSLMLDDIADSGVVVALTDQVGRLLWVEGDSAARDRAGAINFVEGSVWSEEVVGTNAPGVALAIDRGVQILGAEHFAEPVQEWSCAACPVHDPVTGHVLGVIDITGGGAVAAPFALSAVRSVVAAVERELRHPSTDLGDPAAFAAVHAEAAAARLTVLDGGTRLRLGVRSMSLSRRHAEILVLLHHFSEGMGTEQLAIALAENGVDPVTVRAEISRLRRDLPAGMLTSRPYRLVERIRCDVDGVRESIGHGDVLAAVRELGSGGLLAVSVAPGVAEIFEELREDVRSAVLASADVGALRAWIESVHGRDDVAAWNRLGGLLPVGDPDRAMAAGRVRVLDRRLGI